MRVERKTDAEKTVERLEPVLSQRIDNQAEPVAMLFAVGHKHSTLAVIKAMGDAQQIGAPVVDASYTISSAFLCSAAEIFVPLLRTGRVTLAEVEDFLRTSVPLAVADLAAQMAGRAK